MFQDRRPILASDFQRFNLAIEIVGNAGTGTNTLGALGSV